MKCAPMLPRHSLKLVALVLAAHPVMGAQTVDYADGENNPLNYVISGTSDPLTLSVATGSATQSGVLSGTGAVIKEGNGSLTISATAGNTYEGGTTLNAGTLRVADFDPLGTGLLTINSGTLGNAASNEGVFLFNNISITSDFAIDVQGEDGFVEMH